MPFCHSKCAYCDFYSMPCRGSELMDRYVEAVIKEYGMRRGAYGRFSTVYFGGGTPSILPAAGLRRMLEAFAAEAAEVTIEVNPEDVCAESVGAWLSMGFNRVSMGVQSLCDDELRTVGRRHTAAQALEAFRCLRAGGFTNISLDLIYGLPGQDLESWRTSLRRVIGLGPEHLSAYSLTYEPRTKLTAMLHKGEIKEVDDAEAAAMYEVLIAEACKAGYDHYEISNFGKPGFHSRHNSAYWDSTPYLGLGPGAHSFDGRDRSCNPPALKSYLLALESGRLAVEVEEETDAERFNDMIITALRTSQGLPLNSVAACRLPTLMRDAAPHLKRGTLVRQADRLIIPEHEWLMADAVMRDLLQD